MLVTSLTSFKITYIILVGKLNINGDGCLSAIMTKLLSKDKSIAFLARADQRCSLLQENTNTLFSTNFAFDMRIVDIFLSKR